MLFLIILTLLAFNHHVEILSESEINAINDFIENEFMPATSTTSAWNDNCWRRWFTGNRFRLSRLGIWITGRKRHDCYHWIRFKDKLILHFSNHMNLYLSKTFFFFFLSEIYGLDTYTSTESWLPGNAGGSWSLVWICGWLRGKASWYSLEQPCFYHKFCLGFV